MAGHPGPGRASGHELVCGFCLRSPHFSNDAMSPLFLAVIETTEEVIYNALFRATTRGGRGRTVEALPLDRTLETLRRYNALK